MKTQYFCAMAAVQDLSPVNPVRVGLTKIQAFYQLRPTGIIIIAAMPIDGAT